MNDDIVILNIDELVNELSKENLCDLLEQYSRYVIEFSLTHDEGSHPVSLMEYYNNDYFM